MDIRVGEYPHHEESPPLRGEALGRSAHRCRFSPEMPGLRPRADDAPVQGGKKHPLCGAKRSGISHCHCRGFARAMGNGFCAVLSPAPFACGRIFQGALRGCIGSNPESWKSETESRPIVLPGCDGILVRESLYSVRKGAAYVLGLDCFSELFGGLSPAFCRSPPVRDLVVHWRLLAARQLWGGGGAGGCLLPL